MRTPAQIEASKHNGAKSKGPATQEGRARSSQNAVRHGLTSSKVVVIDGESEKEWENFQRQFLLKFQPRDFVEERIVIEMAVCRWRLERVWAMQTSVLNQGITDALPVVEEQFEEYDVTLVQATAHTMRKLDLQSLDQHETRLSRRFDRALRNLKDLRADYPSQPECENEAEAVAEPAEQPKNAKLQNEPKTGIHVMQLPSERPSEPLETPLSSESENEPSENERI